MIMRLKIFHDTLNVLVIIAPGNILAPRTAIIHFSDNYCQYIN